MSMTAAKQAQIGIRVPARMYERIAELASKAKLSTSGYATMLFQAAASERLKPGSAPDLQSAVARVELLSGTRQFNTAEIASFVGLSEATVVRILDVWRQEIGGRGA